MADQNELRERVANIEDQMKQFLTAMEEMTAELRASRTAGPKQKDDSNTTVETVEINDGMPNLEDDPVIIADDRLKIEHEKRFEKLEERMRQLQEIQDSSPTDLSIYAKVKVPKKFKMPEFEKYDGTTCPKAHLQMYLVRMTQYVNNAPLMIQSFQASLTGPALRWYITKRINLLETWDEVSEAFLKQYKFIMDITPSREDLERAEKKKTESFKEYCIRWRNLAAQISPEPTDQELRKIFIKTLPYEYRIRMVTVVTDTFNQLIFVGEQIEIGLRDGWFDEPPMKFTARMMHEDGAIDTLGQPSGKFDYYVKYSAPPSFYTDPRDIVPDGWGGMDGPTPLMTKDPNMMEGIAEGSVCNDIVQTPLKISS